MKKELLLSLPEDFPWRDRLHCYGCVSSTSTVAKALAEAGCPEGTAVIAASQSAGRGRMGRSFFSPEGCGLYLSLVLRPEGKVPMHLTCAAGVAAMRAIERVSGIRPGLKWINDLCWENRKLGGILAEGSLQGEKPYFVIGIGVNCRTPRGGFPSEVADVAASLTDACGRDIPPAALAAELLAQLFKLSRNLTAGKADIMAEYAHSCITLGKEIRVIRAEEVRQGKAVTLTQDGGLMVQYPDGSRETLSSGEVSIRGMYGYL